MNLAWNRLTLPTALTAALLFGAVASGGCDPSCPVGTLNQGSTCKPIRDVDAGHAGVSAGKPGAGMNVVDDEGAGSRAPTGGATAARGARNAGFASPVAGNGGASGAALPDADHTSMGGAGGVADRGRQGPSSGAGGGSAGEEAGRGGEMSRAEPCPQGAMRCTEGSPGGREICRSGSWIADAPCPEDHACTTDSADTSCQPLSEVCVRSGQPSACDPSGVMLACSENGTATKLASCRSAELCEAGLASGRCAQCVPGTFMCNGKDLQRCSMDGSGFQVEADCKSEPLCDGSKGTCKPPACEAGTYTCNGDSLDQCKPDMTGYSSRRCPPGLCDAGKKTCLVCKPSSTTCSGNTLVTCSADGLGTDRGTTCSGALPVCDAASRSCVECKSASDCKTDNACAAVSSCSSSKCLYKPKYAAPSAAGNGKTVRSGLHDPDPVYVAYGNALFWIPNENELLTYYGGFDPVVVTNGELTGYRRCPVPGTLVRERGDPRVYVSTGAALEWVKTPEYLNMCIGTYTDVPTGSLHNTQNPPPAGTCPLVDD